MNRLKPDRTALGDGARQEAARMLAIEALGWLSADQERIGAFLAASGIGPQAMREAAREPHFLAGVLDHIASEDGLMIAFAEHAGVKPEAINRARHALGAVWECDLP